MLKIIGYADQWYNSVSTVDSATPIILYEEENRENINFILCKGGEISGKVLSNTGILWKMFASLWKKTMVIFGIMAILIIRVIIQSLIFRRENITQVQKII